MRQREAILLAFNAFVAVVVLSVLTMLPTSPNSPAVSLSVQHLHAKLAPKHQEVEATPNHQTNQFSFEDAEGRESYTYTLSAIMPLVSCDEFNGESTNTEKHLTQEVSADVTTSILYDFSPLVEDNVRKMFAHNVLKEPWFELHPFQVACLPTDGDFYCALRVWLRMERFQTGDLSKVRNRFQDSFMYTMRIDKNLQFVPGSGSLLGIPSPVQDLAFTGPEDPRIFAINGSIYVNLILGHTYDNVKVSIRRPFLWDIDDSVIYSVQVSRFSMNEWEKNWTPWIVNDTLHFVYQFTPVLRVMRCGITHPPMRTVSCSFLTGQPHYTSIGATAGTLLRGGSPIVRYTVPNYYVAVTHSVQGYQNGRLYAAQVVLLYMSGSTIRIVLISSAIFIDLSTMKSIPNLAAPTIKLPFVYARSVFIENPDSLVMALGLNDNVCYLVRLNGLEPILAAGIENDRKLFAKSECEGEAGAPRFEKWQQGVFGQANQWLRSKNLADSESRFLPQQFLHVISENAG